MKSYSQVRQDVFAYEVCGRITNGTYCDVGCGDPITYNNTYGLELIGWSGVIVDRFEDPLRQPTRPRSKSIVTDARTANWTELLKDLPEEISFLSLDVDENGLDALNAILKSPHTFRVACIEHDKYRIGVQMRDAMRGLMLDRPYALVHPDVLWEGHPFEDWYVSCKVIEKLMLNLC